MSVTFHTNKDEHKWTIFWKTYVVQFLVDVESRWKEIFSKTYKKVKLLKLTCATWFVVDKGPFSFCFGRYGSSDRVGLCCRQINKFK